MIASDLNDSLAFNISRAGLLLRRDLIRTLASYQMTPEQWQIMRTLWQSDEPINQKVIAQFLMKDKHAVSRMIGRLEKNGWVIKQRAPEDARATLISLTEKGKSAISEMSDTLSDHVRNHVFNRFTREEKEQMKIFMKKLRRIMGDAV